LIEKNDCCELIEKVSILFCRRTTSDVAVSAKSVSCPLAIANLGPWERWLPLKLKRNKLA
jgi:hypothetical protein